MSFNEAGRSMPCSRLLRKAYSPMAVTVDGTAQVTFAFPSGYHNSVVISLLYRIPSALQKAGLAEGTSKAVRPLHPADGANSVNSGEKWSTERLRHFSKAFSSTVVVPAGNVSSSSQLQPVNMPRLTVLSAVCRCPS